MALLLLIESVHSFEVGGYALSLLEFAAWRWCQLAGKVVLLGMGGCHSLLAISQLQAHLLWDLQLLACWQMHDVSPAMCLLNQPVKSQCHAAHFAIHLGTWTCGGSRQK